VRSKRRVRKLPRRKPCRYRYFLPSIEGKVKVGVVGGASQEEVCPALPCPLSPFVPRCCARTFTSVRSVRKRAPCCPSGTIDMTVTNQETEVVDRGRGVSGELERGAGITSVQRKSRKMRSVHAAVLFTERLCGSRCYKRQRHGRCNDRRI